MKANQQKGSDGSPVVSLDGMDSSSVHSADALTTPSSTSSPEPYGHQTPSSHSRPGLLTGAWLTFHHNDILNLSFMFTVHW